MVLTFDAMHLVHKLEDATGRRWSYRQIAKETGLSIATVAGMVTGRTHRADTGTLLAFYLLLQSHGVEVVLGDFLRLEEDKQPAA